MKKVISLLTGILLTGFNTLTYAQTPRTDLNIKNAVLSSNQPKMYELFKVEMKNGEKQYYSLGLFNKDFRISLNQETQRQRYAYKDVIDGKINEFTLVKNGNDLLLEETIFILKQPDSPDAQYVVFQCDTDLDYPTVIRKYSRNPNNFLDKTFEGDEWIFDYRAGQLIEEIPAPGSFMTFELANGETEP